MIQRGRHSRFLRLDTTGSARASQDFYRQNEFIDKHGRLTTDESRSKRWPPASSISRSRCRTTSRRTRPATSPRSPTSPTSRARRQVCAYFPGMTPDAVAGWRGLGRGAHRYLHAQRHAPGCAVALRLHDGWGQARHHHRRGAAGVVLPAGREARLPTLPGRLRRHRRRRRGGTRAHRPHAEAA